MVVQVLVRLIFLSLFVFGRDIHRPVNTQVPKDAMNELMEWRAPEKIIKEFPFFLSGYDYVDRPGKKSISLKLRER
ncbi:unnamed protein product [Allacma fusca]|uniref:Uncharacterized protein n=1 Tax=Allacma fusca TaxID=39272 RepID=A0A8J2KSV1_9HEXA|nr:unnamed protein product [Allacma fusca]